MFKEKKRSLFFGLPISLTRYTIDEEKINITSGFLTITDDDALVYKVQDVRLTRSFFERLFGLGTITCYTGDKTHPQLQLLRIRHAKEIKRYIIEKSEEARQKRLLASRAREMGQDEC